MRKELLSKVFNDKNNECGYAKRAYAKYKTNGELKQYTANGTWKKCCSEKESIPEPTKKKQMVLWRLYHQNELLGEFSTRTTRRMWIKIA